MKKFIILVLLPLVDILLSPFTLLSAILLKLIRRGGVYRFKISREIFNFVGIFPVQDHYYEPLFNPKHLKYPLCEPRKLPGINWNIEVQLATLKQFNFNDEILKLKDSNQESNVSFSFENPNFRAGDADYFYNIIRLNKPKNIIEIGSGVSTILAQEAIQKLIELDPKYRCHHVCIEPYEMPWLETMKDVEVMRQIVEEVPLEFFSKLESGDILFIDSSHVIRPQGDVLIEYLEILPILKPGVLIHIHDIFSPRDYPEVWIVDQVRLWNEQYLLEAFLSFNSDFEVIGALNYLKHTFPLELAESCPVFAINPKNCEPGSFWIRRK